MRFVYTLVFTLLIPVICLRLLWRARNAPEYLKRWSERFGLANYRAAVKSSQQGIWIHAVSLGESIAASQLIEHLLESEPESPIIVTNMTPTGSAEIRRRFGNKVHNFYLPYDIPILLRRFIRAINPRLFIIIETELWPNLIFETHKNGIPIWLVNARLSARSARGYQKIAGLTRSMLERLAGVVSQGQEDGDRFVQLGLPSERLHVSGSVKFDITVSQVQKEMVAGLKSHWIGRQIWIAASTHEGEDEQVLVAHQRVLKKFPDALLVLAPRHPERFEAVKQQVLKSGLTIERRSSTQPDSVGKGFDVYLLDTLGELSTLYGVADVAWIGGSFVDSGGHNPLEAAVWGLPVLMGPSQFNFKEITQKLSEQGGLDTVGNELELGNRVISLFSDAETARDKGMVNQRVVQQNQGAVKKLIAALPIRS